MPGRLVLAGGRKPQCLSTGASLKVLGCFHDTSFGFHQNNNPTQKLWCALWPTLTVTLPQFLTGFRPSMMHQGRGLNTRRWETPGHLRGWLPQLHTRMCVSFHIVWKRLYYIEVTDVWSLWTHQSNHPLLDGENNLPFDRMLYCW